MSAPSCILEGKSDVVGAKLKQPVVYLLVGIVAGVIPALVFSYIPPANVQSALEEAKSMARDSQRENSNLRNQITDLSTKLENLRNELSARGGESAARNQLIATLNATLLQLQVSRIALETQISRLDGEKLQLERDKATLTTQVNSLLGKIAVIQQNVTSLQDEKLNLQRRIISLQNQIAELNSVIASLQAQLKLRPAYAEVRTYNFDGDNIGELPRNWTSVSGRWTTILDASAPTPPLAFKQSIQTAGPLYITLEGGEYDFTKGLQIKWSMKILNSIGSGWASAGMVLMYQDNNNYYTLWRDDNGGNNNYFLIRRVVNGVGTNLKSANPRGTTSGSWKNYTVTILATGSQVTMQWDLDGWKDTITDSTTWTNGRVGLLASSVGPSTADVIFDNITISYRVVKSPN